MISLTYSYLFTLHCMKEYIFKKPEKIVKNKNFPFVFNLILNSFLIVCK